MNLKIILLAMRKYLKEVEATLKNLADPRQPLRWLPENYIGGGNSNLKFLSLRIPLVRATSKRGFSFSKLPADQQWPIWDYIWQNSIIYEVMLLSPYWAGRQPVKEIFKHRRLILGWLDRVDNWAHSDELSSHYSKLMEFDPKRMLPVFDKWGRSANPWFKRQSIVGLVYYSRVRKRHPPVNTLLKFIDRHMKDEHYYVQKGVGWALRECWNVYPDKTYDYLLRKAAHLPSAAWTAATEKLSAADKRRLMKLRQI